MSQGGLRLDAKPDVRPVEAGDMDVGVTTKQGLDDIVARHLIGGRRHGGDGRIGEMDPQVAQLIVFRPETVTPLGDAVRLVDDQITDRQFLERRQHALGHQTLGRHIEDRHLARGDLPPDGHVVTARLRRVDRGGPNAGQTQRADLVVSSTPTSGETTTVNPPLINAGTWKTQRLARAGRHNRQRVAPVEQAVDHRLLARPEAVEAEHVLQDAPLGVFDAARRRLLLAQDTHCC